MGKYAPIVIFSYNRPEKTKSVLQSVLEADFANESDIYVYSDGPRSEKDYDKVREVRETIHMIAEHNREYAIRVIEKESNDGLSKSIIMGVSEIINQYGRIIVLEDDNVVSKDFISYMNNCLDYYSHYNNVGSIAGLSYLTEHDFPDDYKKDVYALMRPCSWVWGTWKNRWELIDWDVKDFTSFVHNKKEVQRFNEAGNDLIYLLKAQRYGRVNSWAIRFCYGLFKNKLLTIYPRYSKAKNVGYDGSGTHFNKVEQMSTWEKNISAIDLQKRFNNEDIYLSDVIEDNRIKKKVRLYNNIPPVKRLLKHLKLYYYNLRS